MVSAQQSPLAANGQRPGGPVDRIEIASISALPEAPEMAVSETGSWLSGAAMPPVELVVGTAPPAETARHRFWDRENRALFSVVGGMAAADFCVTHANLASGGRELNPITRVLSGSTPGLATNFALETGGIIGISYMFHKTGHHKLERAVSLMNIGSSAGAVTYGLTHR